MSKNLNLAEEAKKYRQKNKKPPTKTKPLTARRFMAGQAMAALLSRSSGHTHKADIKREAYEWADYMLDDDIE
tara:strand:- start:356 stop:574 length:219 start_codon:yes stop_codon:yes gene_type:complete